MVDIIRTNGEASTIEKLGNTAALALGREV